MADDGVTPLGKIVRRDVLDDHAARAPQLVDGVARCRVLVKSVNDTAKKPGAPKLCAAMWRNEKDQK